MTTITTDRRGTGGATLAAILDQALRWATGQEVLSQGRCVDILLDLYRASNDEFVQWCITERLSDIRFLHAVDAAEMQADLAIIAALCAEPDPAG
jgi:hypothetical protein